MNWYGRILSGYIFIICILTVSASGVVGEQTADEFQQSGGKIIEIARPEHISLNVPDPVAMVKCYIKNIKYSLIEI